MDMITLSLLAMCGVAVLTALAALLTKDNFYAALYMSVTLLVIAGVYALYNVQPVFILIAFIFVGAVGAVTVALAATYRTFEPKLNLDYAWAIPTIVTIAVLGFSLYSYVRYGVDVAYTDVAVAVFSSDYVLLAMFFISLAILLMMSVVKFVRREGA
ncbi:hypothetical protein [Archaeoglobus veneficus]|uniref:F420H2:quinone oxidoreductase, 16.5 kDa subunit, putative n=1 Tax=Archaeoglobus veneficus (strain DSM 11195 / SNP6) TaxID=693661 RepID=F2KQB4_ARCVS|nr:hypothetical protein [Archaeoglobus veneficus]AEA46547.1 F420H2:quinone oxidoreductase, 16.5 kDa subunit, putative [Archaeoglobus veneficus SNP6]